MQPPVPPKEEWRLTTRQLGTRVLVYERLDSTNDLASALADDPANHGIVILADEQTAGRGQHGRSWTCAPGAGVLLSVLLFPPADLRRPVILAAWAANAVCETVRKVTALQSRIKWPNDVLVRGRKICGILIEQKTGVRAQWPGAGVPASRVRKDQPGTSLAAQPDGLPPAPGSVPPDFAVAGIGLNVNQTAESLAEAGLPQAGSLAFFIGGPLDRWEVARQLIAFLDEGYERLCRGDLATLEARWKRRTGLLGRHVLIESQERSYRGRLREIAWDGLVVELARGQTLRLQPEAVKHVTRLSGEW